MAREKYVHVKVLPATEDETNAAAGKIMRLRALRLAKESADKDAASAVITVKKKPHPGD